MRFKVFVAAGAALALAFAAPAHADGYAHTRHFSGGAGSEGSWSSSSDVTSAGVFSVDASVSNLSTMGAAVTPPSASADVMAGNDGTYPPGIYDITATVKNVNADVASTTPDAWAAVTLTITVHCSVCQSTSVNAFAVAAETGTDTTSVRNGTLSTTTRVVLLERGYLLPWATITAEAAGGTRVHVDPAAAFVGYESGDASARATGVIDSVTVTRVEGTPPPLANVSL